MELVGLAASYVLVVALQSCVGLTRFFLRDIDHYPQCRNNDVMNVSNEIDVDGDVGGEEELIERDDAAIVLSRLGMECREWGREGSEVVGELLEEKEASESELKEAFYVFDRNEDGFICVDELWNVMRRLGFEEGRRLKDCERMIKVFDEDGDGKISFLEFRRLLENTT